MKHPIPNFSYDKITQLFGVNRAVYFPAFGLQGHNGIDYVGDFGSPIMAAHDGSILQVIADDPTHTKGNGIYIISPDKTFYTIYWHLSGFNCQPGQLVKTGNVIGYMGNTGFVFPKPTPQKPYDGTHLHFAKVVYSQVNNDYNGCVDPMPDLFQAGDKFVPFWGTDMYYGIEGDRVSWLQTCLSLEGVKGNDYEPLPRYGYKTVRDVRKFQQKYQIYPQWGYFGGKTRVFLNKYLK